MHSRTTRPVNPSGFLLSFFRLAKPSSASCSRYAASAAYQANRAKPGFVGESST